MVQKLCGVVARAIIKIKNMVKTCDFTTRINAVSGFVVLFVVKRNNLFVILFSLIGCQEQSYVVFIDPVLQPYAQSFIESGQSVNYPIVIDNLVMKFSTNLPVNINGQCALRQTPIILINKYVWSLLPEITKKALVFHELGHCVLYLQHDMIWIMIGSDTIPRSIMYPYLQKDLVYLNHWDYYINELFNGP